MNLGTPDAPTPRAIRRYLAQFLSDQRVVEVPRALWLPLLYGVILPFRPRRVAHAYGSIWTAAGSPLLAGTQALAAGLEQRLGRNFPGIPVAIGMTYGTPGIADALDALVKAGVDQLLLLPLYPQYAASSTASAFDACFRWMKRQRAIPEFRAINNYHDDPRYIRTLAEHIRRFDRLNGPGEHLIISFHGIPQRSTALGDPYEHQCRITARLLARELQLPENKVSVGFQSRFGRTAWLQPYMDDLLAELVARGERRVDVICPGFAVDCLETLEEIALGYKEKFEKLGGEQFRYIPALNDSDIHVEMLATIVERALGGWVELPPEAMLVPDLTDTPLLDASHA